MLALWLNQRTTPQGSDLSHLLFTCTNANQAATYTCNTKPRVSPHNVVNHSSLRSDHPSVFGRSGSSISPLMSALTTHIVTKIKKGKHERKESESAQPSNQNRRKARQGHLERKLTNYRLLEWRQKGFDTIGRKRGNDQSTAQQTKGAPPTQMHTPLEDVRAS